MSAYGPWRRWRIRCPKCGGTGLVKTAGEPYTREWLAENDPATLAELLVNGGWAAPAVEKECPRCGGTGRRKK